MREWMGLPAAPGKARGIAFVLPPGADAPKESLGAGAELARLAAGRLRYQKRLAALAGKAGGDEADILAAYAAIAGDDGFFEDVAALIEKEGLSAEAAIERKRAEVAKLFASLPDAVMRRRADDMNNVCGEVAAAMAGKDAAGLPAEGEFVVFAGDLSPVQTLQMDRARLVALVTERGGLSSHTAILAKALGIPAVVAVGPLLGKVSPGADVLVDGGTGRVVLLPDEGTIADFVAAQTEEEKWRTLYAEAAGRPARTWDGAQVGVWANTGDAMSAAGLDFAFCDGVGLFRTEFLYMGRGDWLGEEAQLTVYRDMARRAGGKPVIIRTLDVGADKQAPYMDFPAEENPALGLRGIRRSLLEPETFMAQLRAILRAGAEGDVRVMLPMVAGVEELRAAKDLLAKAAAALEAEGLPYRRDMPLGIMVETPSAVLLADKLAAECDFFSLGTNDLAQYVAAADRMNAGVQQLADPCNVALLRAVNAACEAAVAAGIPVGICGEAAAEPLLIPLWVAMGMEELSVSPALVGSVKYHIGRVDRAEARAALPRVLESATAGEARALLEKLV